MALSAAGDLPLDLDFAWAAGAGAGAGLAAGEGFVATGFLGETLAGAGWGFVATGFAGAAFLTTGAFFAGEDLVGLETFTGAFLAGAGCLGAGFVAGLGAGFAAGFFEGLGGAFLGADFFAGAGFLGAGAFLADFVLETERDELFGEGLDLVFKRLSMESSTLGQKADEDRPTGFSGQGFVFGFFDAPPVGGWSRRHGF